MMTPVTEARLASRCTPPGTVEGPFVLDAAFVAQRFGMTLDRMRVLMDRRMVVSRVEEGVGEDAGRWRLTLRSGNRVWRGVFTTDGRLCEETFGLASRQALSKDRGRA